METVDAPRRRWGRTTGLLGVGGIGGDGRQGLRSLSPAHRASAERGRAVWRALGKRGLQTPVTLTTDGASGLRQAVAAMWPRARRRRGWFHPRQHRPQHVPPQAGPACTAWVAALRDAPTCEAGQRRRQPLLTQYQAPCPEACRCLEEDAEARGHPLQGPRRHRP